MIGELLVGAVLGAVPTFYLTRSHTERRIAVHGMRRTWTNRNAHRK